MREQRNYNNRKRRRRRHSVSYGGRRIISLCAAGIAALLALSVCFCLLAPVFDVENVVCEGNSKVSADTIKNAAGIQTGRNIFLTTLSDKEDMVSGLDYIESCEISRVMPDTIKITVVERHPAAYFEVGGTLAVTAMDGTVMELVGGSDADQIKSAKVHEKQPEPTGSPDSNAEKEDEDDSGEPDPESTADGTIWGYDDDGDPIYRINGGHYEFDEDGNRFFVDDTPEETAEPTEEPGLNAESGDNIERTDGGTVIYSAPVVVGVNITKSDAGKKIASGDEEKFSSVLDALRILDSVGLLERTTEFDAENVNDVKFYIEDRLQVWFGSFEDFEYKAKFTATVVDKNLSAYEHAIMDFRDDKLYVRSESYKTPESIDLSPSADPKAEKDVDEPETSASKKTKSSGDDEEGVDADESSGEDTDEDTDAKPKSTPRSKAASTPKPAAEPDEEDEEGLEN